MSAYVAFAQSAFQTQLAYRNEVWANLFGKLVQVFARVAIWLAVYAGATSIADVSLSQMVTYALLGGVITGAIRYELIISSIGNALKTGDVAVWLLKPVSFPLYVIVSELGRALFRLIFLVVPTVAVVALVYGMLPPASSMASCSSLTCCWAMPSPASSRRCSGFSPSGSSPRSRSNG